MASKKLTSDEVNALMEGLDDSAQAINIDVSSSDEVRPFAFGAFATALAPWACCLVVHPYLLGDLDVWHGWC